MYSGTWQNQYCFLPHELDLCGQSVQIIHWGTILGTCDDTISELIHRALKHRKSYTFSSAVSYLNKNLSAPLSLCTLGIQTENNTLELSFQDEKLLRFNLSSGEHYLYRVDLPAFPTFLIPADVLIDIIEVALFLLSAAPPQQVEISLQKLEIFSNGPALIPIH